LRFSTNEWPERDRVAIWREVYGREIFQVDIEPLPNAPFFGDMTVHSLPGVGVLQSKVGGLRTSRTRSLVSDGTDDLILLVNLAGPLSASQRTRDIEFKDGSAALMAVDEVGTLTRPGFGQGLSLSMQRTQIAPLLPRHRDVVMRPIPPQSAALQLLIKYVHTLQPTDFSDRTLAPLIATHICDLVATIVGATADANEIVKGRGIPAARLATIKADIVANLVCNDLSVTWIARRQGISPRQIHRLFETEGRSFSEFVLAQRLIRAHRMLTDQRFAQWTIAAIADETGFAERSHFNRAIRRQYGASPSELRASHSVASD
jgi:AraC-like DNA-binding protein